MNREKLNDAAENHAKVMGDVPVINSTHAFKSGADWLMQQPLSERLTDDEKEKIRALYNGETFGELDFIELVSTRRIFKNLFGPELFEEK